MTQFPAATVAVHDSVPSLAVTVTVPVGVPPLDVTENVTVTASPGADGSGASAVIVVVVGAFCTSIVADVTEVWPLAAKINVCGPVAPVMRSYRRSRVRSRPWCAWLLPASVPSPEATATVIATPLRPTSLPDRSRSWITGD